MLILAQKVREEVFSFTPDTTIPNDPQIHIRSGRLREFLLKYAMDKVGSLEFPDTETEAEMYVRHGIEPERLETMTPEEASEPVIVLEDDNQHILCDGNHRRVYWAKRGVHTIQGWVVPKAIWQEYIFDINDPMLIHHNFDGTTLPQRRSAQK